MERASMIGANLIVGAVCILLCLPLLFGLVPPNKWYGVRFPAAYKSRENWYRINRFGAIVVLMFGAVVLLIGSLPMLLNWQPTFPESILLMMSPLFLLLIVVLSIMLYSRKL